MTGPIACSGDWNKRRNTAFSTGFMSGGASLAMLVATPPGHMECTATATPPPGLSRRDSSVANVHCTSLLAP